MVYEELNNDRILWTNRGEGARVENSVDQN